jgi:hypothetical protein
VSEPYNYSCRGRVISSSHYLTDYMPDLAVALVEAIGISDDADTSKAFVADLLAASERGGTMFPADLKRQSKEMRLVRLLKEPVTVDGLVLSYVVAPKRRMYEKTKMVVIRRAHIQAALDSRPDVQAGMTALRLARPGTPVAAGLRTPVVYAQPTVAPLIDAASCLKMAFTAPLDSEMAFTAPLDSEMGSADLSHRLAVLEAGMSALDLYVKEQIVTLGIRLNRVDIKLSGAQSAATMQEV